MQLLGIDIAAARRRPLDPVARLTVTHPLIAGTGYLWAPVIITMADALCAFGVSHHWPEGACQLPPPWTARPTSSRARGEGEQVTATASPLHLGRTTQVWDATVTNETTERLMASYRCTQLILY